MKDPIEAENALTEAEKICHRKVCDILGLRSGVDCFISTNGGKVECAVFDIGSAWTGDVAAFPATAYHWRGQLDMYSRNRSQIQKWMMRLLLALPQGKGQPLGTDIDETTNVGLFRLAPESDYLSEITTTQLKSAANAEGVEVFTATAKFDIIFTVGQNRPSAH